MADNSTGLPVQTLTGQFVQTKIVDSSGSNVAAVSAAGRVSVDASGVVVPVSDNAGTLTVDAPVGTPVFVRLSDGAATLIGQKTMAASLPVVIASDQGALSVTLSSSVVDTELPAAAALADNAATPTAPAVGAFNMVYDGATWDLLRGTAVDGMLVNLGTNNDVTVTSGSITADTELPAAAALADATANPTVPGVGAFMMGWNGTTWDRVDTANTGRLQVDVVTGGGSNASILVDNAGFTDATSSVTGVGYIFDEVAGTALTENDIAAARIDSKRAQIHVIEDATSRGQRWAISATGRGSMDLTGVGGAAIALGQTTMAASLPVTIASNQSSLTVDTELTAVAALADATANPTITSISGYLMGYNGTTWDRVRTANTGRLQVDVVTGGGTNASILVDNAGFTDATSSVTGVGFIYDEVAGTVLTENDIAAARIDIKRAQVLVMEDATTRGQRLAISAAGAAASNITQVSGAAQSATNPLFIRMTDGTAAISNLGQTGATGQFVRLNDGTTTAAVTASLTALKVDLVGRNGTIDSATNPISVRLTDGSAFYASASAAPVSAQFSTQTSAALGAGANVDLQTADITTAKTGRLDGIDVASTVPLKIIISTVSASTPTTRVILFSAPYSGIQWRAPFQTYITQAGGTNNKFRVNLTNKDASVAADVYATFFWDEV